MCQIQLQIIEIYLSKMIPLQKIFTLLVKTFSKPLLTRLKNARANKKSLYIDSWFIFFGRQCIIIENAINARFRNIKQHRKTQINEEKALEKGIQTFYEIALYALILGFPLYEMYKNSVDSKKKEEKLYMRLDGIQEKINEATERLLKLKNQKSIREIA